MPSRNEQVKRETSLAKVPKKGRLKAIEPAAHGSAKDVSGASLARTSPSANGEGINSPLRGRRRVTAPFLVPVQDASGKPLMPCHPARARELVRKGRAVRRFDHGIFFVRLIDREGGGIQPIAVGIDPGSKKEGFTVKSEKHTYLNIQADAVTWVSKAVETKRNMRRARRSRKTPCRATRKNRSRGSLPPSTKARWQWKLRLACWLSKLYPITGFVVEDIKARTKGQRRWDQSFSPLEVGKNWFYGELSKIAPVELKQGWETKELRDELGLKKTSRKLAEVFEAHCVDSWVLANWSVGGHAKPDNTRLLCISPIRLCRRQLHMLQPSEGGIRRRQGGTRSLGFKRGSLVLHYTFGLCYVGGTCNNRVSLHSSVTGKRLTKTAKVLECTPVSYNSWKLHLYSNFV